MKRLVKHSKPLIALGLSGLLVLTMMPNMTSADNTETATVTLESKVLGTSIIADPTAPADNYTAWTGSYVYFGAYDGSPIKYRVLDSNTTEYGSTTMLLDSNGTLWSGKFDDSSNVWNDSYIKKYLNSEGDYDTTGFLTTAFSKSEQDAIAVSNKATASATDGDGWFSLGFAPLENSKIFLLDAVEMTNTSYGYSNTYDYSVNKQKSGSSEAWWLRSPRLKQEKNVGWVDIDSYLLSCPVDATYPGISPALNVDLSAVIFSSLISGTMGQSGAEYKLTVLDKNMTVAIDGKLERKGDEITIPYEITGENADNATQVSMMVLDKEYTIGNSNGAKLISYEKLDGSFNLTEDMKNSTYYYYILAEDVNGEKETDYASTPVAFSIPSEITYGDSNGDGKINVMDAVLMKKHIAGFEDLAIYLDASDVNKDTNINVMDAVMVLKHIAGFDVELGS